MKNGKVKVIIAIVSLSVVILGVVGGVIYGYATLEHQVADNAEMKEANEKDHSKFETDIDSCKEWMGETGKELVGIKKDIGFLTEKVDNNAVVQQQILTEIREINK